MASLSANERSFLAMMTKSDEHAREGFALLLKRSDPLRFLDALIDAGLFGAAHNPGPVPVRPEGHVRLPYWTALDYLVACARAAGATADLQLAQKLLKIIRDVSVGGASEDSRDNFHTFRKFAEIIGLLPLASLRRKDLKLVKGWLNTKFDRYMVALALDEGALTRFLASAVPGDWLKALQLLAYCTAIRWEPSRVFRDTQDPVTMVEEYWLRKLIGHHASSVGHKKEVAGVAARLFARRVRALFGRPGRAELSYVLRPAVEDDAQNRRVTTAESCLVEGLRDVLLGWCVVDPTAAKPFVHLLLRSENQMLRRVGIFVLGRQWAQLKELYSANVNPAFFDGGQLHELYTLLRDHFGAFDDAQKRATVEAIRNLPAPTGDDATERLELLQRRWLSAIAPTTYEPAVTWFAELTQKHGPQPEHPDHLAFVEGHWGPGPSPYSVSDLIALAAEGTIVEKLSAFRPSDTSRGSTLEALVDAIERAVGAAPASFFGVLPAFLAAPRRFQYGLVNGFLKHWRDAGGSAASRDWDDVVWNRLFDFFDGLLKDSRFRPNSAGERREESYGRVADAIADLLHEGTRADAHAYPASLLPRGWSLIQTLVEHGDPVAEPGNDPMTQAINSSKGRALEAAFSHILRSCRLADRENGSHDAPWARARGLIEGELALCVGGNFEFSTLAAAYLGNWEYIDARWLKDHIGEIFPLAQTTNLGCALGGLAYAAMNRSTYQTLRDAGVMDAALRLEIKGPHGRDKLMERLTLGYLWEEETIDSPRFAYLFEEDRAEDLDSISFVLWRIQRETLTPKQVRRVLEYWGRCVEWARGQAARPAKVLSGLSRLAPFLESAAAENRDLLLEVAPYVDVHGNAYAFLSELNRLVEVSPAQVCEVLKIFVDTHELLYDYEDRMQTLVRCLATLGSRQDAIELCNKLRSLPGVVDLFNELTSSS